MEKIKFQIEIEMKNFKEMRQWLIDMGCDDNMTDEETMMASIDMTDRHGEELFTHNPDKFKIIKL